MALLHRGCPTHVLVHSDRGVQYASAGYRATLANAHLVASMRRKGHGYDNAEAATLPCRGDKENTQVRETQEI